MKEEVTSRETQQQLVSKVYQALSNKHYPKKAELRKIAKQMGFELDFVNTYYEFDRQEFITYVYNKDGVCIKTEEDQFETEQHFRDYLKSIKEAVQHLDNLLSEPLGEITKEEIAHNNHLFNDDES